VYLPFFDDGILWDKATSHTLVASQDSSIECEGLLDASKIARWRNSRLLPKVSINQKGKVVSEILGKRLCTPHRIREKRSWWSSADGRMGLGVFVQDLDLDHILYLGRLAGVRPLVWYQSTVVSDSSDLHFIDSSAEPQVSMQHPIVCTP
jgi:hypothetical protein